MSDPANPLLAHEQGSGIDPGELLRGLVDVRGRLEKINDIKTGRGKLVNAVIDGGRPGLPDTALVDSTSVGNKQANPQDLAELDERVGELESIIGSSSTSLDEVGYSNTSHPMIFTASFSCRRSRPLCCRCSRD